MLTPLPPFTSLLDRGNAPNSASNYSKAFPAQQFPAQSFSAQQSQRENGIGDLVGRGSNKNNFAIFNDILQKSYQRIAFSPASTQQVNSDPIQNQSDAAVQNVPGYQRVGKISSQQAAGTILGFISQRLESDKANGATSQELLQRLEEGASGFIKGFNEAKDIIEGMGLLTPDLAGEIGDTYDIVTKGIEALRNEINGTPISEVNRLTLAGERAESESFSLELTTKDGDKVSIEISRSAQTSFASSIERSGNSSMVSISQQNSSSSRFNLNVVGELDEDEMAAINQLLEDVDQIAGDFFQGNLDQAFNQALELDIDREELSSLNLQLQKTTTRRALTAYESTAQVGTNSPGAHSVSPIIELNNLLDNVQNILDEARVFAEPLKLLDALNNGVALLNNESQEQQQNNGLNDMINALVSKFNL